MSKHSIKKYIKQNTKKKKTINKKYNKKKNMRKSNRNKSKNRRKTYKLKGGSGYNTLTPSPIMNAWYNLMSYPYYLTNVFNGSNSPNYLNSDPTAGHLI